MEPHDPGRIYDLGMEAGRKEAREVLLEEIARLFLHGGDLREWLLQQGEALPPDLRQEVSVLPPKKDLPPLRPDDPWPVHLQLREGPGWVCRGCGASFGSFHETLQHTARCPQPGFALTA